MTSHAHDRIDARRRRDPDDAQACGQHRSDRGVEPRHRSGGGPADRRGRTRRMSTFAPPGASTLGRDHRRQQLLVGAWIGDEIAERERGSAPRRATVRSTRRPNTGCGPAWSPNSRDRGPLEPFLSDPTRGGDRRQQPPLHVGHLHRWAQGRRRAAVGERHRTHVVPEADGAADDRHRRGAARHVVADAHVAVDRRRARRDGARRRRRARHLDASRAWRSVDSSSARSASTGSPTSACSRTTSSTNSAPWSAAASRSSCRGRPAPARRRC